MMIRETGTPNGVRVAGEAVLTDSRPTVTHRSPFPTRTGRGRRLSSHRL
ncbi:hypothetical protein HMPREF1979_02282 [Actinomyces johnsonii F0542]|uniref:Uncharacterized protein n=1 Tax=Actinomyces johnsonii F0542 TaxID=1321818 RepID=U1Q445_9ACTO|nr:hypothetical protein HMPREF1979_02282 [Actinomyces johnsonii F0542]